MAKRLLGWLLTILAVVGLAACDAETSLADAPLTEIMDEVYAVAGEQYGFEPHWQLDIVQKPIDPTENEWYFGANIAYEEALASEYVIMPPAYSVCLVRVAATDSAETVAATIRASADPRKWVCTGVSRVEVLWSGNLVFLVMADGTNADALVSAFETLF